MSTLESAQAAAVPVVAEHRIPHEKPRIRDTWWRHGVALVAIAFSLFPVAYVLSAAVNPVSSLGAATLLPRDLTLHNFGILLHDPSTKFLRWYANSMVVSVTTALLTVILGALAAYAFSRFRFRGRRMGMMALLLIQMFPSILNVVAIYLIMLRTGEVFPKFGLNTLVGLIIVYLAGVLGVNAWLMKGFFDTIPSELDESAKVDGATPAQIFWGIVMPLAAPVLAVIGLLSFIGTLNELIFASALLQTTDNFTLPVGMRGFIDQQYAEHWGPYAAGVVLAAPPAVALFLFLQRYIVHGLTAGSVKG